MKTIRYSITVLNRLQQNEHFYLHKNIVQILDGKIDAIATLFTKFNEYKELYLQLDEYYRQSNKFLETDELIELRKIRDNLVYSIKHALDSAWYDLQPAWKMAARTLQLIMNTYKNAVNAPYAASIADIYNMIQDFRMPENEVYVSLLELEGKINALNEKNNALEELFNLRSAKKEEKILYQEIKDTRLKLNTSAIELMRLIESMYNIGEINHEEEDLQELLLDFINKINALLTQSREDLYRHLNTPKPAEQPENKEPYPYSEEDIPRFRMEHLVVYDSDPEKGEQYGRRISIAAQNITEFENVLAPLALGATITFNPENSNPAYTATVIEILAVSEGTIPIGLILGKPGNYWYAIPAVTTPIDPVKLMKDGQCIAILEDFPYVTVLRN